MGLDWYDGARVLQEKQGKYHMASGRRLVRGNKASSRHFKGFLWWVYSFSYVRGFLRVLHGYEF